MGDPKTGSPFFINIHRKRIIGKKHGSLGDFNSGRNCSKPVCFA